MKAILSSMMINIPNIKELDHNPVFRSRGHEATLELFLLLLQRQGEFRQADKKLRRLGNGKLGIWHDMMTTRVTAW